ncbi:DUF1559 domain-containing protein [Aquisphaera insulae]|uniref:DUF1559 domain-containing protein n=1 Tax=Aquisphaera insulae TaxID=2712864 RepID=UPI0013ED78C7|nr:DUF1559 domain-containing protein [Aquisphaera insulae]
MRTGFTLVETLVTLVIIGLLLAILAPAVQSARESARRTACQNNLRQVTAAVLQHESTFRALPSLYNGTFLPQPRSGIDEFHFHSWRTAILAHLEQRPVFASLNLALPATTPANQTGLNATVGTFLCPSTSTPNMNVPAILEWNDGKFPTRSIGTAARSDYEIVGGVRIKHQTGSSSDLSIVRFGAWGEPTYNLATGASIRYRVARLADITDGLSHSVLIAERGGRPDMYRKGMPPEIYPYSTPTAGMDHHQAAWAVSTHFWWTVASKDQPINQTNATGIFSFHPGGANAAFGDGSVRFLKTTTRADVLNAIGTRAGGEVVSEP